MITLAFMAKINYGNRVKHISIEVKIFSLTNTQSKEEWMGINGIMISNSLSKIENIPQGHPIQI